jgi:uncharacterized protein (TIGR00730 family)
MNPTRLILVALAFCSAALACAAVPAAPRVTDRLSVCVYCGASDLADPKYAEAARQLGAGLARRQWTLVWGGSKTGLMGAVARSAKEAGGRVVGVLPEFIRRWEVAYDRADEMMVVTTMHERKLLLQSRADAFVILPGGIGTLDELGDTLDLRNLDRHRKPIILFNQDGYYDSLLAFVDQTVAAKFSKEEARRQFRVARTVDEVLALLEEIDRDEASESHAAAHAQG